MSHITSDSFVAKETKKLKNTIQRPSWNVNVWHFTQFDKEANKRVNKTANNLAAALVHMENVRKLYFQSHPQETQTERRAI